MNETTVETKPKRVIVCVEGGIADATMDSGVEWELLDWDNIRSGSDVWTHEDINRLEEWGKGLVREDVIEELRELVDEFANEAKENES